MNEYTVIMKNGTAYVYADTYTLINKQACFYKDGKLLQVLYRVASVTNTTSDPI